MLWAKDSVRSRQGQSPLTVRLGTSGILPKCLPEKTSQSLQNFHMPHVPRLNSMFCRGCFKE
jgi:hypothetical protein